MSENPVANMLSDVLAVSEKVVDVMVGGVFSEDPEDNEHYVNTVHLMVKSFVESLDGIFQKLEHEHEKNSVFSLALSFLQSSMNIICRGADNEFKKKVIQMAFPECEIHVSQRTSVDCVEDIKDESQEMDE